MRYYKTRKFVFITPFSQNFCQNFWSDNKKRFVLNAKMFFFKMSFQEHKSVNSVCEGSILAVHIAKCGPLREPIRMLLFTLDQFSQVIKCHSNGWLGLRIADILSTLFCSVIGTPPQSDWPTNVSLPRSSFLRYVPFSLAELIPEMCKSGIHLLKVRQNNNHNNNNNNNNNRKYEKVVFSDLQHREISRTYMNELSYTCTLYATSYLYNPQFLNLQCKLTYM